MTEDTAAAPTATATGDTPLSGTQYVIEAHGYQATVASTGATLRELTFDGRDLTVPFAADEVRRNFRGATLAPWPNRIIDGTYTFAGEDRQLALTEPERGHALHGLVSWVDFSVVEHVGDAVTLAAIIPPQVGYPHRVRVSVTFTVSSDGLTQSIGATNVGDTTAPYGCSAHPYLVAGEGIVDDWTLELSASDVFLTEGDRLLPDRVASVDSVLDGTLDFRGGRVIGDTFVDHAYTSLEFSPRATVRVTTAAGSGVAIEFDEACPWVQIHTADRPAPEPSRIGLAVEPMTCPPDAFNSKTDVVELEPGATHEVSWRISAL
ncbi:aldose 1-epimerase family protein [Marisediminicola sp. LYQ134]|uniref:aldose 1-epimerase family protein n=1 Tax=Marisediminicola sp. LYQ134 TaxID=3391061 RepID=UPI0039831CED